MEVTSLFPFFPLRRPRECFVLAASCLALGGAFCTRTGTLQRHGSPATASSDSTRTQPPRRRENNSTRTNNIHSQKEKPPHRHLSIRCPAADSWCILHPFGHHPSCTVSRIHPAQPPQPFSNTVPQLRHTWIQSSHHNPCNHHTLCDQHVDIHPPP